MGSFKLAVHQTAHNLDQDQQRLIANSFRKVSVSIFVLFHHLFHPFYQRFVCEYFSSSGGTTWGEKASLVFS